VRESCLDAFAEGLAVLGGAAGIRQIGVHERQAVVEDQPVAPTYHSEQANQLGRGRRYRHHVGRIVYGLNALHNRRRETTKRAFRVVLLFEGTLDRVGEEKSFASKFRKQRGFTRFRCERNSCRLHKLFEKSARTERAIGRIHGGAVEVVFDSNGRRSIEEKNADSSGAQTGCKFEPVGPESKMSVVRSCPAPLANRQLGPPHENDEDVTGIADNASCRMRLPGSRGLNAGVYLGDRTNPVYRLPASGAGQEWNCRRFPIQDFCNKGLKAFTARPIGTTCFGR